MSDPHATGSRADDETVTTGGGVKPGHGTVGTTGGRYGNATPDRAARLEQLCGLLIEQWNDTAAQLEGNRDAGLRGIAAGRRECAEALQVIVHRSLGIEP